MLSAWSLLDNNLKEIKRASLLFRVGLVNDVMNLRDQTTPVRWPLFIRPWNQPIVMFHNLWRTTLKIAENATQNNNKFVFALSHAKFFHSINKQLSFIVFLHFVRFFNSFLHCFRNSLFASLLNNLRALKYLEVIESCYGGNFQCFIEEKLQSRSVFSFPLLRFAHHRFLN